MGKPKLAVSVVTSPPRAESSYTLSRLLPFPVTEMPIRTSIAASLDEDSVAILERTEVLERGVAVILRDDTTEESRDFVELNPISERPVKIRITGRSAGQIRVIPSSDDPI